MEFILYIFLLGFAYKILHWVYKGYSHRYEIKVRKSGSTALDLTPREKENLTLVESPNIRRTIEQRILRAKSLGLDSVLCNLGHDLMFPALEPLTHNKLVEPYPLFTKAEIVNEEKLSYRLEKRTVRIKLNGKDYIVKSERERPHFDFGKELCIDGNPIYSYYTHEIFFEDRMVFNVIIAQAYTEGEYSVSIERCESIEGFLEGDWVKEFKNWDSHETKVWKEYNPFR